MTGGPWINEHGSTSQGPLTFLNSLTEDRREQALFLAGNAMMLAMLSFDFKAAARLMNALDDKRFKGIAARDAVMTIYHFGRCAEIVKASVREMEEINHRTPELKAAVKPFLDNYPPRRLQWIRDSVAHRAELMKDVATFTTGAVGNSRYLGNITGSVYRITNRNEHFELTIDEMTSEVLTDTVIRVFDALPELRLHECFDFAGRAT